MKRQTHGSAGREIREGLREQWRPIHPGEAFMRHTPLTRRLIAQALHYEEVDRLQRAAAALAAGTAPRDNEEMRTSPQLNSLYSDLPSRFAAQAAAGHTAYLEYRSRAEHFFRSDFIGEARFERLLALLKIDGAAERMLVAEVLRACTEAVASRVCLHAMAREDGLGAVEHYRIYLAAQARLPPTSITELVQLTAVLGDLLGPLLDGCIRTAHPILLGPLAAATAVSRLMEVQLAEAEIDELTTLSPEWIEALMMAVTPGALNALKAPRPRVKPRRRTHPGQRGQPPAVGADPADRTSEDVIRIALDQEDAPLEPLDTPAAPRILPETATDAPPRLEEVLKEAVNALLDPLGVVADNADPLDTGIHEVLRSANEEGPMRHQPRPDRVQAAARSAPFNVGALQGNPTGINVVEDILWGDAEGHKGVVLHEVLVPPRDSGDWRRLREDARPIANQLRKVLYPDLVSRQTLVRYRSSGAPDSRRLPLYPFSDSIYLQHRQVQTPSPSNNNRSVVLLACDGSGSMQENEIRVLKLLTCAFIESLAGIRGLLLLAGAYNSGHSPATRTSVPKVHWLHHPKLTPGRTPLDAARALTAFPDTGSGRNHDTISLSYMLDEAAGLARGGTCYMVNITDTRFNSPLPKRSGTEIMEEFLRGAKALDEISLDYTLVGIGAAEDYRLDGADAVLPVLPEELKDTAAIAARVARYVADSVTARREKLESGRAT